MSRPNADRSFLNSSVDWPEFDAGWFLPGSVLLRGNGPTRLGLATFVATFALFGLTPQAFSQTEESVADQPTANEQPTVSPSANGLITIESDTQSADNITCVVTAIGNVRIVYPARGMVSTSRQAQYFSKEGRLILSGDVDVTQDDGNALRAERVIYLLDEERAEAVPPSGEQVFSQMVIKPSNGKGPTPLTP